VAPGQGTPYGIGIEGDGEIDARFRSTRARQKKEILAPVDNSRFTCQGTNKEPTNMMIVRRHFLSFCLALSLLPACGKEVVRGADDPSIDDHAMSTGLDKRDIQKMLSENLNHLRSAPVMSKWRQDGGKDLVAVFPFTNTTSEHIDSQLEAALAEAETWLIDSQVVTVVSRERQQAMIAEVEGQQSAAFNPRNVARYGKQLGVKYFLTGKVAASDERIEDERRVQYFFYMEIIEVETSAIRWRHKAYVTKMIR
jgi:penicillin-binding protein activator